MTSSPDIDDLYADVITALEVRGGQGERVAVSVGNAYTFEIAADLVRRHGLAEGDEISVETQRRLLIADEIDEAKETALNYLSYKPRTTGEVKRRLRRDEFREEVIDEVVYQLEEQDYLDDRTYARLFAEERFSSKGYGPYRVQQDLRKRGVSEPIIDQVIDEIFDADEMREEALRRAEKRWSRLSNEEDFRKRRKKLYDFLARRGFPFEIVREVVDEVAYGD